MSSRVLPSGQMVRTSRPSHPRAAAGLALAAAVLLAGPSPPPLRAQDSTSTLVDQLGTLSLTEALDSRGALGGVAVDALGFVYVASFNRLELARVDPSGNVSSWATVPGAPGNAHIAFARGFLYVTKILANQVVKVSPEAPATGTDGP